MARLFDSVTRFVRSPQGRRLAGNARRFTQDPENRRRLERVRSRLGRRRV